MTDTDPHHSPAGPNQGPTRSPAPPDRLSPGEVLAGVHHSALRALSLIPLTPDILHGLECFRLVELCQLYRVDYSLHAAPRGTPGERVQLFPVWKRDEEGQYVNVLCSCRVRLDRNILDEPDGVWVPDFGLLDAYVLVGQLRERAVRDLRLINEEGAGGGGRA